MEIENKLLSFICFLSSNQTHLSIVIYNAFDFIFTNIIISTEESPQQIMSIKLIK